MCLLNNGSEKIIIFHRQNIKKCYKCVLKISLLLAPKIKLFSEQIFSRWLFSFAILENSTKRKSIRYEQKTSQYYTVVWDDQTGLVEIETNPFHSEGRQKW